MSNNIPEDLKYTKTHEWVKLESDNTIIVGITEHAQEQLGEIVFVELPEINNTISQEEDLCVVESVKSASDLYAPLSGEIIEINEKLIDNPEIVNSDPYGEGWFCKIKLENITDYKESILLISPSEYSKSITEETCESEEKIEEIEEC